MEDQSDLLHQSRKWVAAHGRAEARDRLIEALAGQDESGGFYEFRMLAANGDKSLVFPKSLYTIPRKERNRVGLYFVLGIEQEKGRAAPIIRKAVEHMKLLGFRAKLINVAPRRTAEEDSLVLAETLKNDLPFVDKAVLIGFSRGSADIVHFWLGPAQEIPECQLKKIRIWVNFSGVVRGSAVARWVALGKNPSAWLFRAFYNIKSMRPRSSMLDVASIAYDRWAFSGNSFPESMRGRLHVINFVAIPDGATGWASMDPYNNILARNAKKSGALLGPCDGMVESAASVLPPHTGIQQSIVRVRGAHLILSGEYLSGNQVAAKYHQGRRAQLESGSQLMDDFLRAMPRSLIE